jgi:hypothetical protein
MNLSQIKTEIKNGSYNIDELNSVIAYVNSVKVQQAKSSLKIGDSVWMVQKSKRTLGVILKVKIKKAHVRLPGGTYNVPLTMLEAA